MRFTTWMAAGGMVAMSLVSGCTNTQKGAAIGGAVGAGTGAIWANQTPTMNSLNGAAVGLAAGGLTGALVGDALDEVNAQDRKDEQRVQIGSLNGQLSAKDAELDNMKNELDRLRAELAKKPQMAAQPEVKIESKDGTIRFTILNEILYDSGKAELKKEGLATLDSVIELIQKEFPDRRIMVEGHTDADPIKVSNWKTNWELSSARSLAVVHYLMTEKNLAGDKLASAAFGEFKPVAANDTNENKRQNRRAVIVVMPPDSNIIVDRK